MVERPGREQFLSLLAAAGPTGACLYNSLHLLLDYYEREVAEWVCAEIREDVFMTNSVLLIRKLKEEQNNRV